jgi:hypothetical protein
MVHCRIGSLEMYGDEVVRQQDVHCRIGVASRVIIYPVEAGHYFKLGK